MMSRRILSNTRFTHTWIKPEGYDTGIKVYNCVAKETVPLVLRNKDFTTWYTCGPTVYDSAHIGHASCYVKLDIIQRILKNYFKINLITAMNITDVDDKIINRSNQEKTSVLKITQNYEKEFWEDMIKLKITKPNIVVRVTEYMPAIQNFIKELLVQNIAYKTKDGSISFKIQSYEHYGKLHNINQISNLENNHSENQKTDFTMWKAAKENEPYWDADFGKGRPGWHTECSALASSIFGPQIDIHAGGIDLRFPHHENEETQCCTYFKKSQWVNYWFHTGHLLQNSTKMSKSLNNTVTIRDMLKLCNANTFRMMCLISHFRKNMEFTMEYVKTAEKLLENYHNFINLCNSCIDGKLKPNINSEVLITALTKSILEIHSALIDDFDTASCIKSLNSLVTVTNKMLNSASTTEDNNLNNLASLIAVLNLVTNTLDLFGLSEQQILPETQENYNVKEITDILIEFREKIRLQGIDSKDQTLLKFCDGVRNNLRDIGINVKDHGKVSSWSWSK